MERSADRKWFSWDEGAQKLNEYGFGSEQVALKDLGIIAEQNTDGACSIYLKAGEGSPVRASSRAVNELNKILGANLRMLGSLADAPALLRQVVDHLKNRKSLDGLTILQDRDGVRAVTADPEEIVDPGRAFSTTREVLDDSPGLAEMLYSKGRGEFEFLALTAETQEPPRKVGDVSHVGINVHVNGGALIEPAVYTLRCSNGLIAGDVVESSRALSSDEIRTAVGRARTLASRFVGLDDQPVENPAAVIARIAEEMSLPDRTARKILDTVSTNLQGENVTAYEVVNAVTRLRHGQESNRFSRLGGLMMEPLTAQRCDHCGARTK